MIKWEYSEVTWYSPRIDKMSGGWEPVSLPEFMKEDFSERGGLDAMGNEGWELVTVIEFNEDDLRGKTYYFKRLLPN
jgi:hypothetical protein